MARKTKRTKKRIITPDVCPFCEKEKVPDYKDYKYLAKYLTDRAKIIGKVYTGVCTRHQRLLSREIKRARHLGLLPFTPKLG